MAKFWEIEVGDRVVLERQPTHEYPQAKIVGRIIAASGDRYAVKDEITGLEFWGGKVHYRPTPKEVAKRCRVIRQSWRDRRLRRELELSLVVYGYDIHHARKTKKANAACETNRKKRRSKVSKASG